MTSESGEAKSLTSVEAEDLLEGPFGPERVKVMSSNFVMGEVK